MYMIICLGASLFELFCNEAFVVREKVPHYIQTPLKHILGRRRLKTGCLEQEDVESLRLP